eukprot:1139967-Pelagomonas_calceolata.AAC.10
MIDANEGHIFGMEATPHAILILCKVPFLPSARCTSPHHSYHPFGAFFKSKERIHGCDKGVTPAEQASEQGSQQRALKPELDTAHKTWTQKHEEDEAQRFQSCWIRFDRWKNRSRSGMGFFRQPLEG